MTRFDEVLFTGNAVRLGYEIDSVISNLLPAFTTYINNSKYREEDLKTGFVKHQCPDLDAAKPTVIFMFHFGMYIDMCMSIGEQFPDRKVCALIESSSDQNHLEKMQRLYRRFTKNGITLIEVGQNLSFLKNIRTAVNQNAIFICFIDMPSSTSSAAIEKFDFMETTLRLNNGFFKIAKKFKLETFLGISLPSEDYLSAKAIVSKVHNMADIGHEMFPLLQAKPYLWFNTSKLHFLSSFKETTLKGIYLCFQFEETNYLYNIDDNEFCNINEYLYDLISENLNDVGFLSELTNALPEGFADTISKLVVL